MVNVKVIRAETMKTKALGDSGEGVCMVADFEVKNPLSGHPMPFRLVGPAVPGESTASRMSASFQLACVLMALGIKIDLTQNET